MWLLATGIQGSSAAWANHSNLHPVGFALVLGLGLATLMVPRRYALVPMFIMACFVAQAQRLVVFSIDFSLIRIMVLFVFARILARREYRGFQWSIVDSLFVSLWLVNSIAYILLWGTTDAIIYRLGVGFESMGIYFLARMVIRDWSDLIGFVRLAALLAVPVACFFLIENQTGRNLFSVFGGVPEITIIREGRLRCQGPFAHAIIAGVFWASLMPLFAALWWQGSRNRWVALAGILSGLVMVICCASSTPVLALAAGLAGACMFPMRGRMKNVLVGCILMLTALHLVMQAPVWHLIARVSAVGGSTGWHRFNLIDQTIRRFDEWALIGVRATGHWGHALNDVTNQYVLQAVTGGFVTLVLFVVLLCVVFRGIGRALKLVARQRRYLILTWAVGVMLFVHCTSFIGVSYFGQVDMVWYVSLAIATNIDQVLAPKLALNRHPKQREAVNVPPLQVRQAPAGLHTG